MTSLTPFIPTPSPVVTSLTHFLPTATSAPPLTSLHTTVIQTASSQPSIQVTPQPTLTPAPLAPPAPVPAIQEFRSSGMSSAIKLSKFLGDGTQNPDTWLVEFLQWSSFFDLNNAKKLSSFPFHLESHAKFWYLSLPEDVTKSWEHLKHAFVTRFKDTHDMIDGSLFEVKQTDSESVLQYMARLNITLANKTLDPAIRLAITLQGLKPSIRNSVVMKEPKNLDQLRHAALLCEKTMKTTASGSDAVLEAVLSKINKIESKMGPGSSVNGTYNGESLLPNDESTCPQGSIQQAMQRHAQWDRPQYYNNHYNQNRSMSKPNHQTQRLSHPSHFMKPSYNSYQYNPNTSSPRRSQDIAQPPHVGMRHFPQTPVYTNQSCQGCGKSCISRSKCPAFGRQCHHCLKLNHFSSVCRTVRRQ